ncbi:Rep [Chicken proventriculitis-associated circular virus 24]|nr:Rep [Chicken proventriculitis-associated circular virus 24]
MNHAQLVFKPLKDANGVQDISGYSYEELLKDCPRYVICNEIGTEKEKPHTHIYLETADCEKTIRNKLLRCLQIPKSTRGKGSAFYGLFYNKYKDPSPAYIVKEGNIFQSKGYTQSELDHYIMQGSFRYLKQLEADLTENIATVANAPSVTTVVGLNEFDKLKAAHSRREGYKEMSMDQIKRWIKYYYLKQGKCIPREGDTRRYAYSLWTLSHFANLQEEDINAAERHEMFPS